MIFDSFNDFSKEMRVNVFAYDYEGYGKSNGCCWFTSRPKLNHEINLSFNYPGSCSESHCYDDIDAAYNYLIDKKNIRPENIVLYGRSLGTGPSCYLAQRLKRENVSVGALVLQVRNIESTDHSRGFNSPPLLITKESVSFNLSSRLQLSIHSAWRYVPQCGQSAGGRLSSLCDSRNERWSRSFLEWRGCIL